ncbi:MAG: GTA-gp10 family protein [Pseudomonadota bacterium]|nr:GTA-gp10 family protein [Pseudomonadota bacterium]
MANRVRGEVRLAIGDREVVLVATLGALADIEDRMGVHLADLGSRLAQPRVKDLMLLTEILSDGAVTVDALRALDPVEMLAIGNAVTGALAALSWAGDDEDTDQGNA